MHGTLAPAPCLHPAPMLPKSAAYCNCSMFMVWSLGNRVILSPCVSGGHLENTHRGQTSLWGDLPFSTPPSSRGASPSTPLPTAGGASPPAPLGEQTCRRAPWWVTFAFSCPWAGWCASGRVRGGGSQNPRFSASGALARGAGKMIGCAPSFAFVCAPRVDRFVELALVRCASVHRLQGTLPGDPVLTAVGGGCASRNSTNPSCLANGRVDVGPPADPSSDSCSGDSYSCEAWLMCRLYHDGVVQVVACSRWQHLQLCGSGLCV